MSPQTIDVRTYLLQQQSLVVRNLQVGESIPPVLLRDMGLAMTQPMPEWVWIAEQAEEIVGVLVTAPCHGVIILLRLLVKPAAPSTIPLLLLRRASRDARRRGYTSYMTLLDRSRTTEDHLARVAFQQGATIWPAPHTLVVGPLGAKGGM